MDRSTLLETMRTERARFEAWVAAVPPDAWDEPVNGEWTRKDTVAHVEAWERRAATLYRILSSGGDPGAPGSDGTLDEINARFHAESRDRSLDDVLRGEAAAYRELLAIVEAALDADLFDATRFSWLDGEAFATIVTTNTIEHWTDHEEHLASR